MANTRRIRVSVNGNQVTEYRELNATEALAKELTLTFTPNDATKVLLDLPNGTTQIYDFDYEVVGNILRWGGKALETILEETDKLRVFYFIDN